MSFTDSLLGIGSAIQSGVEHIPGVKAAGGALRTVSKDVSNAFAGDYSKSAKQEVDTKARKDAPNFVPLASALQLQRDSLAADRDREVARIQNLPQTNRLTGPGTTVTKSTGAQSFKTAPPLPIPPAPSAFDLAKKKATNEVVQEILDLQKSGAIAPRSTFRGFAQAVEKGGTIGIGGQEDMANPFAKAQYIQRPLGKAEGIARTGLEMSAAMVPYGVTGNLIGTAARSVGFLNEMYQSNQFAYGMLVNNLGVNMVDGAVRKGSGQEYGATDMVTGLMMGGLFEGAFAGLHSLQGVQHGKVISQIDNVAKAMYEESGKMPSLPELYANVKGVQVEGAPKGTTFDSVLKESRLAYFSSIDPETGMPRKGRPGMDFPAEIDATPRTDATVDLPPPPDAIGGVDAGPVDAPWDTHAKLAKAEFTDQELSDIFSEAKGWEKFKDGSGQLWDTTKKFWGRLMDANYLKKLNPEGEKIAGMIDMADQSRAIDVNNALKDGIPILRSLSPEESVRMADIAEGRIAPSNPKEQQFSDWWNRVRTDIADKAQNAGLTIRTDAGEVVPFTPRENYLPRSVKYDELQTALKKIGEMKPSEKEIFLQRMKGSLERTGGIRFENTTEVERYLQRKSTKPKSVYGNLERAREANIPDAFVERDVKKILPEYIQSAYARVADATQFGPNQEKVSSLIDVAKIRDGEQVAKDMTEYVNRITGLEAIKSEGYFNPTIKAVSKAARTYEVLTKMSLSGVSNFGDLVKPFVRNDWMSTLKAVGQSFARDAEPLPGMIEHNLSALAADMGDSKLSEGLLKWTGFNWTENKVRAVNANSAINYTETLAKRLNKSLEAVGGNIEKMDNAFAYRRLAQYFEDPEAIIRRGYLTTAEKDIAAYKGIADTQPLRRLETPYYWQTPSGRVFTQFKGFAYKAMSFSRDFIYNEAKQGNVRPLMSFLVLGQVIGEPVADLKAFIRGRDRDNNIGRRIIDNYMTVGGVGLATDFLSNVQYGSMGGGFLRFVAGPALTDLGDWMERIASPKRVERIGKKLLYSAPVVGPGISNAMFPARQVYRARTAPILDDVLDLLDKKKGGGGSTQGGPKVRLPSPPGSTSRAIRPLR